MAININGTGSITGLSSISSPTISGGNFPAGTAVSPGITLSGDTDTGLYSPGTNQIAIATSGVAALTIDASQRVGIGVTSPNAAARTHIVSSGTGTGAGDNVALRLSSNGSGYSSTLAFSNEVDASYAISLVGSSLTFNSGVTTERARIDSSGRLLVGTSSSISTPIYENGAWAPQACKEQFAGITAADSSLSISVFQNLANGGAQLSLNKSRSSTVGTFGGNALATNNELGAITFAGDDGSKFVAAASITCATDATPGANDMPGRLVFSTTADGASSPTERMRITSGGYFKAKADTVYQSESGTYHEFNSTASASPVLNILNKNASYSSAVLNGGADRAANSGYDFQNWYSAYSGSFDLEFRLRGDGNGLCDGSWTGGGADYAEFFEWSDANPNNEDRRGISVVLDGNQIREAVIDEDPIGVISGNPSVVGDAAWNKWNGKYLRDEFGSYLLDENGDRQLNPAFDPDHEYIPREQRPEWDCVGLMGKLRIRKGQVTGSRWIKMRDISDTVEEWLVR